MQNSLPKRLGYRALQELARLVATALYRVRVVGRENVPRSSGGLVCANHQSYLDPVLIGLSVDRRLNFLARDTLFRIPLLKQAMDYFDAIAIDREGSGLRGLKETLRRLKQGEMVLIFPEGTRSHDGELQPFKAGFCSVARRGKQPLIPLGLDGAFQAWPRTNALPRLSKIAVVIGKPITTAEMTTLSDDELVAELQRRVATCFARARELRA